MHNLIIEEIEKKNIRKYCYIWQTRNLNFLFFMFCINKTQRKLIIMLKEKKKNEAVEYHLN